MLSTDALTLAVDDDGDLDIASGTLRFLSGTAGVAELVGARIELRRGEFFAARFRGLPLYENDYVPPADAILGSAYDEDKARRAYADRILGAPAIARILRLDIEFDPATRTLRPTWEARAAFDDITETARS